MTEQKVYVPVTPGGTVIHWLQSESEAQAWEKLLVDAAHMPYRGISAFKARGYHVEHMSAAEMKAKAWFPRAMAK